MFLREVVGEQSKVGNMIALPSEQWEREPASELCRDRNANCPAASCILSMTPSSPMNTYYCPHTHTLCPIQVCKMLGLTPTAKWTQLLSWWVKRKASDNQTNWNPFISMHQDPEHSAHLPDLTMSPLSCSLHSNPTLSSFQFLQPAPSSAPFRLQTCCSFCLRPFLCHLLGSGICSSSLLSGEWGPPEHPGLPTSKPSPLP